MCLAPFYHHSFLGLTTNKCAFKFTFFHLNDEPYVVVCYGDSSDGGNNDEDVDVFIATIIIEPSTLDYAPQKSIRVASQDRVKLKRN